MVRDHHFTDSRTGKVKGEYSSNYVKHEVPIRSRPWEHRGLWTIDLEQVSKNQELGEGR
jgi:hypothetical protein